MITKNNPHKFTKCTLEGGNSPTEIHWFKVLHAEVAKANFTAWIVQLCKPINSSFWQYTLDWWCTILKNKTHLKKIKHKWVCIFLLSSFPQLSFYKNVRTVGAIYGQCRFFLSILLQMYRFQWKCYIVSNLEVIVEEAICIKQPDTILIKYYQEIYTLVCNQYKCLIRNFIFKVKIFKKLC